ncbi:hypothetical protein SAMN02745823_00422 [Sporobacter termitidis DSM 10068]|uniref:C1q domain-containing protein n=1 Tax=Sporobacter termitidis DSM 10068 TaxID=1123282 RepID=A0A1M5UAU2_9FIRM|nr:hypothetical protein [Sporobacter termitidis]SHH59803.1 hypothetical protein SAMN02745823_00422 [Sporobacter termitidis DSM 10068]
MSDIALQIERTTAGSVGVSNNVIFNNIAYLSGNISYDDSTGVITLNKQGRYVINWWVSTQASVSTNGAAFMLSSSADDSLLGTSPNRAGEVCGTGIIDVTAAPVTVSLVNASTSAVYYAPLVPLTASLVVIEDDQREGFSAFISSVSTSASTQLTGWTVTPPYFDSAGFNEAAGNYTVPTTGIYSVQATINYSTNSAISISLGSGVNPAFVVRRTSPTLTNLIGGLFPLLDVSVALLTLRTILSNGTVTLAGEISLTAGDVVGLFYNADGLTVPLTLGGSEAAGIVWSMNRIA